MKSISTLFRQLFLIVVLISAFSLSAWGETTVEMTTFSATSASMDDVISYSTAKGGGTSNPAINSGEIRLYQNSAGTGGGYITITAKKNYTISSVTIGSSMTTSVAHTIGSSSTKSSESSLAANGKHTISDINDQSVTIYCMGKTSSSRLYVNYLSVTYAPIGILEEYTITWKNGDETHTTTTYTEGDALTLPATDPTSCSDNYSTFIGWYSEQAGSTSNKSTELQGTEASKTDITGPTTFYAVFGDANGTSIPTESSIDFSKQGYGNGATITSCEIGDAIVTFNNGSNSNSPTYYTSGTAIRAYGGNNFTISSETTISSITITFGSSDGSNAITTDCGTYSGGTWTGSANSVKFTIGGSSGNRRIQKISVTTTSTSSSAYISTCDGEEVINPDAPTFNPAGGNFTETQSVEISAEDGAMIYYTTNGDDPTTESILYNGAIEVSTTTTIKAIAVLNGVESGISTTEYRINIVDDIAAFIEKQPTVETKILGTVTVVAQDKSKQRIWVQDNSGAIMIYSSPALDMEYTAGQQFTNLKGKYAEYNGSTQLQTTELPIATEGQVRTPTEATLENIVNNMNNYIHKYVKINDISYDGTAISDGTNSLSLYDHFGTDLSNVNKEYKANVEGIVGYYNTNQFYILKYEEIIPIIPTISTNVTTIDFNDVKQGATSDKNFTIEFYNLTSEINIKCDNSSFNLTTEEVSESEWSVEITFNAPTQVGIQEGTITISSEGAEPKTVTLTANVYEAYTIKFGSTEKETNVKGKVTEIPTLDGVVGWTTNSVFAIVDEKPNVIDENTIFEENTQLYPVYSITEEGQEEAWTLVTDASTLVVGDQVVIAAADYNYALSTNQKSNNRGQISIIKNNNTITLNNEVQILTLEEGTTSGTFAFNTGSGYLYAASSSSNHLKTNDDKDANGSWKITITDGVASIVAQGTNTRSTMQYNQSSSLFACYESASQKAIALYKKTGGAITKYNIAGNKTVDNNTTFDVENNINVNTLTIKSNFDEAGEVKVIDGGLNASKVIVEKTIGQTWCFFSLPYDCNVADVVATASDTTLTYAPNENDGSYVIAEYNGGWVELLGTSHTLNANQGYIIGQFTDNTEVTVKFPSNGAQTILAPTDTTITKTSDKGFNLIGLPYYQKDAASLNNVEYLTLPNKDGMTYTQTEYSADTMATIAPFTSFFIQTEGTIEFTIAAQQNAAPMMRANGVTNKAVVTLTDANGGVDKTTIINNPNNTTDYEIGHDLTKLIGYASIPQIYSHQGEKMLAFNSLAIDNSTVIPLGVYAHADGEYTFALNEKSMGDLQGWELYDNETGKTTRLAYEDLTIYLEQGTHEGRFEIRLQQRITTNCDNSMGDMTTWTANGTLNINNLPADAVVYIYDAVGRMIYVATPNANTFNYSFVARGVYNIVVRSADNTVSFKTIY